MNIQDLKNKYQGKRIFIIGNGPSLNKTPLDLLTNEYTFAFNKIHLLYDKTNWRPSFFANGWALHKPVDSSPETAGIMESIKLGIPCFVWQSHQEYFPKRNNIYFYNDIDLLQRKEFGRYELDIDKINDYNQIWSEDVSKKVYRYNTVLYPAIQIAVYMGFREIYLVGCDMFNVPEQHMIFKNASNPAEYRKNYRQYNNSSAINIALQYFKESKQSFRSAINGFVYLLLHHTKPNKLRLLIVRIANICWGIGDKNHFNAGYSSRKWSIKFINKQLLLAHRLMKLASQRFNFKIYNATVGGHLEVHERVNINELLKTDTRK